MDARTPDEPSPRRRLSALSRLVHPRLREALPTTDDLRRVRHRWHRVLVLSALTGLLVGLAVAAFEAVVGQRLLEWTLGLPAGIQVFAPAIGLVLTWSALRYAGRGASPASADEYLIAYHERSGDLPLREVPGKVLGSATTLGAGGAMGFEGPAIYIGSTVGSAVCRRFSRYFESVDRRLLLVAGAAAGVSAIFKAPATGAVFALEVPYRDDSASHAAVPAIVAAAAAYLAFVSFFGLDRLFPVAGDTPPLDARDLLGALAMGALAGIGARVFALALRRAKAVGQSVSVVKRLATTGLVLTVVAGVTVLVYDAPLSLGPGLGAVDWARGAPRALGLVLLLLLIRAVATWATLAGGGVGGLFFPLFVEGWLLGTAVEVVLSTDTLLFPVIGAAAFLGAGYRTPIAAVVFVAESTGRPGFIVPALLATAVAQLVMGEQSVTGFQLPRRLDRVERRARLPIERAVVAVPECSPETPVADVVGRPDAVPPVGVVALVERGRWMGLVERARAESFLAAGSIGSVARDLATADVVVADRSWTVGQVSEAVATAPAGAVAVVEHGRLVGVVTPASILAAERDLR